MTAVFKYRTRRSAGTTAAIGDRPHSIRNEFALPESVESLVYGRIAPQAQSSTHEIGSWHPPRPSLGRFDPIEFALDSARASPSACDYPPPAAIAFEHARRVLECIDRLDDLGNWSTVVSAAGGIAISNVDDRSDIYVMFECLNSGTCLILIESESEESVINVRPEDLTWDDPVVLDAVLATK